MLARRLTDRLSLVLACCLLDLLVHAGTHNQWATGAVRYYRAPLNQGQPHHYPCNETLIVRAHDSGYFLLPYLPLDGDKHYCQIIIGTRQQGFRIRFTFNQTELAISRQQHHENKASCSDEYVHVGNSRYAVDIKSMTSYKFCEEEKPQEVVSREGKLWLIYSSHGSGVFSGMRINFDVLPYVKCNTEGNKTYFRCSPVECIQYGLLCDGRVHCSNGRDEYCDRTKLTEVHSWKTPTSTTTAMPSNVSSIDMKLISAPHHDVITCFLCEDGTCIRPTLPIYHVNRGQRWWWLCDNFPHCMDGTDERMDVCLTMQSKSSQLYDCPIRQSAGSESLSHTSVGAVLWRRLTCDTVPHCDGGEDEDEVMCAPKNNDDSIFRSKIFIPVTAVFVFTISITLVYHRDKCKRLLLPKRRHKRKKGGVRTRYKQTPRRVHIIDIEKTPKPEAEFINRPIIITPTRTTSWKTSGDLPEIDALQRTELHPNYFILSQTAV